MRWNSIPDFETDPVLRLDRSDLVRRERDHRGPWLRFLALSYRMQLDRVEDLPDRTPRYLF